MLKAPSTYIGTRPSRKLRTMRVELRL